MEWSELLKDNVTLKSLNNAAFWKYFKLAMELASGEEKGR